MLSEGALALDQQPAPARGPIYRRPEEACLYRRPFDSDFRSCPAYVPYIYMPEDLRGRQMLPVLSCAHTQIGRRPGARHRYFTACGLGTPEDRERWAAENQAP